MLFNYQNQNPTDIYKLMSQAIIPRPIAWIVTENDGVVNVAPFSYFTGLSSNPPTMIVSIGHKSDGTPKDTLANIRRNKKCTVCMVDPKHLEMMHFSSKELQGDVSEAESFDIPLKNVAEGYPPMVDGAPVAFFCDLYSEVDLGQSKTIPLIIEIKKQYISDDAITDVEKMVVEYKPLARVGKKYALPGDTVEPPAIP